MKLMPLVLIINLLLSFSAQSYEVGDVIDKDIARQLNVPAGKIAVVDFFASWCASCAKEVPGIKRFIKQDVDKKAQVIGVDVDEVLEDGLIFQKNLGVDFTVINDTEQKIIGAFSPIGMPALYYIVDNKVVGKRIGAIHKIDEQIKKDLLSFGVEVK